MKRETTTISFVKVVMHRHGNIFCSGTNISNSEISKHSFKCVILYYAITSIFTTFKRKTLIYWIYKSNLHFRNANSYIIIFTIYRPTKYSHVCNFFEKSLFNLLV